MARQLALCVLLSVLSFNVFASGWIGQRSIDRVQQRECTSAEKGLEITFTSDIANPDGCLSVRTINIACDAGGYEAMVSMSLMAVAANKKIDVWVNGCEGDGQAKGVSMVIRP